MANEYFTPSGYPATGAAGSSASMRSEMALVEDGFDKLPTLTGNGGKIVAVNSGGTGLTTSATLSESGGTMTVTGNVTVNGAVSLQGGTFTFNDAGADLDARFEGDTDANLLFLDASTDRVGVGTSTPAAKFHVFGAAKVGTGAASNSHTLMVNNPNGTGTALQLFQDSQESWAMGLPASSTALTWSNSGAERMRITSAGDVGIGVTNPAYKLVVSAGGASGIEFGPAFSGTANLIQSYNRSGSAYVDTVYEAAQHRFNISSAEAMRINSSGNIGIGTNSPAQILDIIKAQNAGTVAVVRNGNTGASASAQFIVNADTATGRFAAYSSGAGALANHVSIEQTTNNPITFYTNGSERVRITGTGNVGIGVNNPTARLTVNGDIITQPGSGGAFTAYETDATRANQLVLKADASGSLINASYATGGSGVLRFQTENVERMRITAGGDVGIGTSTPLVTAAGRGNVTINGSTSSIVALGVGGAATASFYADATVVNISSRTNIPLLLSTNDAERMRITSSGDVGIGTNSPSKKLMVNGFSNLGGSVYSVVIGDGTFSAGVASIAAESGSRLDIGTAGANSLHLFANNTERMRITSAGNIIAGAQSALATTATDGFLYVPTCAGTPTGTPTAITGMAPIVVNTTNNKLYFYSGGAWRDAGP